MEKPARFIQDSLGNYWMTLVVNLFNFVVMLATLYKAIIKKQPIGIFIILLLVLSIAGFIIINGYSLVVRKKNQSLREVMSHLHKINHYYRDVLHTVFHVETPNMDSKAIELEMRQTLAKVCRSIERIFQNLCAGKECLASVKLIKKKSDGRYVAETYARSEEDCERDKDTPTEYEINTGKNTAFDVALTFRRAGERSYFYSGDLKADADIEKYYNERTNYLKFYKSAIVVPIRYLDYNKIGMPNASDDIGFLSIDTKSRNRLEEGYQVELLAALADQIYNFYCLMRGKYSVPGQ